LTPKVPKKQETFKGKDNEGTYTVNLGENSKDTNLNIDRIIGLSAPASRAPRKKKDTSSTTKSKVKAKGKEVAGTSKSPNAKGKEKSKEKEVPIEDVPMDEDASETNNIDDMYMDE